MSIKWASVSVEQPNSPHLTAVFEKRMKVISRRPCIYLQVPFPMGVNVRTRPGKPRTITHEENQQGSPSNLAGGEDSSNGDASSGSGKESD
jgi:hypothetical protein